MGKSQKSLRLQELPRDDQPNLADLGLVLEDLGMYLGDTETEFSRQDYILPILNVGGGGGGLGGGDGGGFVGGGGSLIGWGGLVGRGRLVGGGGIWLLLGIDRFSFVLDIGNISLGSGSVGHDLHSAIGKVDPVLARGAVVAPLLLLGEHGTVAVVHSVLVLNKQQLINIITRGRSRRSLRTGTKQTTVIEHYNTGP